MCFSYEIRWHCLVTIVSTVVSASPTCSWTCFGWRPFCMYTSTTLHKFLFWRIWEADQRMRKYSAALLTCSCWCSFFSHLWQVEYSDYYISALIIPSMSIPVKSSASSRDQLLSYYNWRHRHDSPCERSPRCLWHAQAQTIRFWECVRCPTYLLCENCHNAANDYVEEELGHVHDHPQRPYAYECDCCESQPIFRRRWRCQVCEDFEPCEECYHGVDDADMPSGHSKEHLMTAVEGIPNPNQRHGTELCQTSESPVGISGGRYGSSVVQVVAATTLSEHFDEDCEGFWSTAKRCSPNCYNIKGRVEWLCRMDWGTIFHYFVFSLQLSINYVLNCTKYYIG